MNARMKVLAAVILVPVVAALVQCHGDLTGPRPQAADLEPPAHDSDEYQLSAHSILRADLLACRNPGAQIQRGSDGSIADFAAQLHGTWIGKRRTMHGEPVTTDQLFLFDLRGENGVGLLIDRANLGSRFTSGVDLRSVSHAFTLVNCTFEFLDRYEKISDEVRIDLLAGGTEIPMRGVANLHQAWERLVSAGYFDSFEMPVDARGNTRVVRQDGEARGGRVAILPDGRVVTQAEIAAGSAPGAEYRLPSITGGLFDIRLTLKRPDGAEYTGVHMLWSATYRGVGAEIPAGEAIPGRERGLFMKDGDSYVSAPTAVHPRRGTSGFAGMQASVFAETEGDGDLWTTDDCPEKNDLNAVAPYRVSIASDPAHADHDHTALTFSRVVIGRP